MSETPDEVKVLAAEAVDAVMNMVTDDYEKMLFAVVDAVAKELESATRYEVQCPSCGATIRARMADADPIVNRYTEDGHMTPEYADHLLGHEEDGK